MSAGQEDDRQQPISATPEGGPPAPSPDRAENRTAVSQRTPREEPTRVGRTVGQPRQPVVVQARVHTSGDDHDQQLLGENGTRSDGPADWSARTTGHPAPARAWRSAHRRSAAPYAGGPLPGRSAARQQRRRRTRADAVPPSQANEPTASRDSGRHDRIRPSRSHSLTRVASRSTAEAIDSATLAG